MSGDRSEFEINKIKDGRKVGASPALGAPYDFKNSSDFDFDEWQRKDSEADARWFFIQGSFVLSILVVLFVLACRFF